jgi:hypothetical protein
VSSCDFRDAARQLRRARSALKMSDVDMPRDPLAAVPPLLEEARTILAASDTRGDAVAEALLADLEECVVAAHRLVLRRRIEGQAK